MLRLIPNTTVLKVWFNTRLLAQITGDTAQAVFIPVFVIRRKYQTCKMSAFHSATMQQYVVCIHFQQFESNFWRRTLYSWICLCPEYRQDLNRWMTTGLGWQRMAQIRVTEWTILKKKCGNCSTEMLRDDNVSQSNLKKYVHSVIPTILCRPSSVTFH